MVVFCTYCGQSFTRDEHLERHILTHTNVKPFKCFTCHMSFARRDLLQRHYTVHGKDQNQEPIPAANGMIPKSAGRTPIACSNCAKTKTKCDKKFPCSRCAGRNLTCTLRPTRRTSKNASRMGMIVGPDGTTLMPAPPGMLKPDNGVHHPPLQPAVAHTPPQQHALRPASSKDKLSSIVEENADQLPLSLSAHKTSPRAPIAVSPASSSQCPPHVLTEELVNNGGSDEEDEAAAAAAAPSPRFMLDWSQMQMPIGFDGMVPPHVLMQPGMPPFHPNMVQTMGPPPPEAMLGMIPDMASNVAPLITPMESPLIGRSFSEVDVSGPAGFFEPGQLPFSSFPDGKADLGAIIAAQDGWNAFRCTPVIPSSSCPRTARLNLERLEQSLKNHKGWSTWSPRWQEADFAGGEHLTVMQLHESTRDKLLAITQSFLHKALDIHRDHSSNMHPAESGRLTPTHNGSSNFVLLPPARVLEFFLRSYANCFERHFPLTSRAILDANELMHCYNDKASSLLVLTMVAQGAMNIPDTESKLLTGGLTEACRISLFDLIEKDIIMAADPIVLHAALLLINQAAWSGDKWQMDIAMGQRGMYFAMLRHSGFLDNRVTPSPPNAAQRPRTEQLWRDWIQNESRSRLVYSWTMIDQDLSLFHDTAPLFSVTEFNTPLPDTDRLWHAKSAAEWSTIFEQVHEFTGGFSSIGSGARPMSLRELFRLFLNDELVTRGIEMTPMQLRLLLHPLQSMLWQFMQLLSCFADPLSMRNHGTRVVSASSTRSRMQEVQSLLSRWFDLAERYLKANPLCEMMQTNLILFHLISLNAVTTFPEIERMARRENIDGTFQQLVWLHQRCITDVEEAVFHCGQVLRHVRAMPRGIRPQWWSGAIYRVGLVLWADSLVRNPSVQSVTPPGSVSPTRGPSFAIDVLSPDHPLIVRYLTKREGVPCLTRRDGSQLPLEQPFQILQHCIECIDEGPSTRLSDGIKMKLDRLSKG